MGNDIGEIAVCLLEFLENLGISSAQDRNMMRKLVLSAKPSLPGYLDPFLERAKRWR